MPPKYGIFIIVLGLIYRADLPAQEPFGKAMISGTCSPDSLKSLFDEYDAITGPGKGLGKGPFNRWYEFISERSHTEPFDPFAIDKALLEYPLLFGQNLNGNWTYLPFEFEQGQPVEGSGAGRVNMVRNFSWDPDNWYACAPAGGVWRSSDNGNTWQSLGTDFNPSIGVSDIAVHPIQPNILYIATGDSDSGVTYSVGVMKSTDSGMTWNVTGLNSTVQDAYYTNRLAVSPLAPSWLFAATSHGLFRSQDEGQNFEELLDGEFEEIHFDLDDPLRLYAVGDTAIFISINGGDSWTHITSGLPTGNDIVRMSLAQSPADPDYLYLIVCGNNYGLHGIYRSTDRGLTFTQRHGSSPNVLSADSNGLSAGGQGWYDLAIACDKDDPNRILTGGINIWQSVDGASTMQLFSDWTGTPFHAYIHADIHSIQPVPGSFHFLVGHDGGVSVIDGNSVSDVSAGLEIAQVRSFGFRRNQSATVLGGWQDNGINLIEGGTLSHHIDFDGTTCRISPLNDQLMFGSIQNGTIYRSMNGGQNFGVIVNSGQTGVNETGSFVTPFSLGPDYGHFFVGKSRVYKSDDNGSTFTSLAAFGSGPIREMDVSLSNPDYIYASKNLSLYRSSNGNNFTLLAGLPGQYISGIEISDSDPLLVWVCFSGYNANAKVYRTTTGGNSWTNLSDGLPNIPINCIVHQRDIPGAIYVGTDAGVFYRDNTTGGWIPFNTNLPLSPVTELSISYEEKSIIASTYGRGIWRSPLFAVSSNEAGILAVLSPIGSTCSEHIVPTILVVNNGQESIENMTVQMIYEGNVVQESTFNQFIASGQEMSLAFDTLDFTPSPTFELTFVITTVNGIVDSFTGNDTFSATAQLDLSGTVPIKLEYSLLCEASELILSVVGTGGEIYYSETGFEDYSYVERHFCISDGCAEVIVDGFAGSIACNSNGGAISNPLTNEIIIEIPTDISQYASYLFCAGDITYGCTNSAACNYDPEADWDNDSCVFGSEPYILTIYSDFWGDEISWSLIDENNVVINSALPESINSLMLYSWELYLDSACYSLIIADSFGDGITSPGYFTVADPEGNIIVNNPPYGNQITLTLCSEVSNDEMCEEMFGCLDPAACNFDVAATYNDNTCTFPGCNDPEACNFDQNAGCDNGSCLYPGCTDIAACNFDPSAACDDGGCDFSCFGSCPGDLDNNGTIGTSDLLIFIGSFGCTGECGTADITANGQVGTDDLLILLSTFGTVCP